MDSHKAQVFDKEEIQALGEHFMSPFENIDLIYC